MKNSAIVLSSLALEPIEAGSNQLHLGKLPVSSSCDWLIDSSIVLLLSKFLQIWFLGSLLKIDCHSCAKSSH